MHFPIAVLLGGGALARYAWWCRRVRLARTATGLLVAGGLTPVLAAFAGLLAYF